MLRRSTPPPSPRRQATRTLASDVAQAPTRGGTCRHRNRMFHRRTRTRTAAALRRLTTASPSAHRAPPSATPNYCRNPDPAKTDDILFPFNSFHYHYPPLAARYPYYLFAILAPQLYTTAYALLIHPHPCIFAFAFSSRLDFCSSRPQRDFSALGSPRIFISHIARRPVPFPLRPCVRRPSLEDHRDINIYPDHSARTRHARSCIPGIAQPVTPAPSHHCPILHGIIWHHTLTSIYLRAHPSVSLQSPPSGLGPCIIIYLAVQTVSRRLYQYPTTPFSTVARQHLYCTTPSCNLPPPGPPTDLLGSARTVASLHPHRALTSQRPTSHPGSIPLTY